MPQLRYDLFLTEMGWIGAVLSPRGLRRMTLGPTPEETLDQLEPDVSGARHDPEALALVRETVEANLRGEYSPLGDITLDLDWMPPFSRAALEACRSIPPGETRSYAWLASQAGRPGAYRAAGQAMARNPIAIVIPCHRVIGSNGSLHGYGGGLDLKARLLGLENGEPGHS